LLRELRELLNEQLGCLFGVISTKGTILLCSDSSQEGKDFDQFDKLVKDTNDKPAVDGLIFTKIKAIRNVQYYVFVEQMGDNTDFVLNLLALYVKDYLTDNIEKTDKEFFFKQILQNDISGHELDKRNKVFRFDTVAKKTVVTIRTGNVPEYPVSEVLKNLFRDTKNTVITTLDNDDTVMVLAAKEDIEQVLLSAVSTLEEQLMVPVKASIGKYFTLLQDARNSYITSVKAFDIGSLYSEGYSVYNYNNIGIARFFHDIPIEQLEHFIEETITSEVYDRIDDETIKTMQAFFENNLNISETARKMYLHRNTLVYRIEKFNKLTGLDVQKFESAVLFYTICQIKCFLRNMGRD
jgi:carbohydrate diacid regulator